ncbi:MAG: energy transducer TonB [Candidatus Sulfotelmatobacter sp.]
MDVLERGFQLGILPERKIDKRALITSYAFVAMVILIITNIGMLMPDQMPLKQYRVTELIPLPALKPERVRIKRSRIKAKLLPAVKIPVFERPKLVVPREVRHIAPERVEPPKVVMNQFAGPQLRMTSGGARPQLLHTGEFQGSSVIPTVNAAVQKVQTGGFGDPNGLTGTGKQGAKLYAAQSGSFDMPAGAGQGNGSGGAKGIKGTVASADFGNGIATGGHGDGRSSGPGSGVATGGFGSEQVVHGGPKIQADSGPATTPVEITFKPNPEYTNEARNLKLEGEVLLEVSFAANGMLHVNRVVRGLGHGLDEAAVAAANKMRFKPALRNGQPTDSTAVVHVVFQLAY